MRPENFISEVVSEGGGMRQGNKKIVRQQESSRLHLRMF